MAAQTSSEMMNYDSGLKVVCFFHHSWNCPHWGQKSTGFFFFWTVCFFSVQTAVDCDDGVWRRALQWRLPRGPRVKVQFGWWQWELHRSPPSSRPRPRGPTAPQLWLLSAAATMLTKRIILFYIKLPLVQLYPLISQVLNSLALQHWNYNTAGTK